VVEQRVDDDAGAEGEGDEVGHGVGGGEVEWRVGEVGGLGECVVFLEDAFDVVDVAEAVVGLVCGDWEVGEVP
jgi:hypothetical protein